MRKLTGLVATFLLLSEIAVAQVLTAPPTPVYDMPRRLFFNTRTLPKAPRPGHSKAQIKQTCDDNLETCTAGYKIDKPAPSGDTVPNAEGDLRFGCDVAWFGPYDQLVYPDMNGLAHTHVGFGNVQGWKLSDLSQIPVSGNGTCLGGTLNRTGYWVPAPVYSCRAEDVGCDHSRNGEYQSVEETQAYYKSGDGGSDPAVPLWVKAAGRGLKFDVPPRGQQADTYGSGAAARFGDGTTWTTKRLLPGAYTCAAAAFDNVDPAPSNHEWCELYADRQRMVLQWYPAGHKMIAGDPNATSIDPDLHLEVACIQVTFGSDGKELPAEVVSDQYEHMLTASQVYAGKTCNLLRVGIAAPKCWNGEDTDSPGHRAHMRQAAYDCPAGWVRTPAHSILMYVRIKQHADLDFIRLSSDYPKSSGYPAFSTIHFDRIEGFARTPVAPFGIDFPRMLLQACLWPGYDCSGGLIGSPLRDGKYYTAY